MKHLFYIIACSLFFYQCVGPKHASCPDVFAKHKHESLSNNFKKKSKRPPHSTIASEEKTALLEMPLTNLSAALGSGSSSFERSISHYPSLIPMLTDSVPKSEEEIEKERMRKEILRLKQEIEKKKQNFENPDQQSGLPSDGDAAIYKKANNLAKVSFFTVLLSPILSPLLIVSLVTGFMSLKRYRKITNKKGRWMAITGLVLDFILLAILLIAIISFIFWWSEWAA